MLTHQLIEQHVGAIKLLVAQYRHDLELEDINDHDAITKSFDESVRKALRDFGAQVDPVKTDPASDEQLLRTLAEKTPMYFRSVAEENGFIAGPKDAPDENDRDQTIRCAMMDIAHMVEVGSEGEYALTFNQKKGVSGLLKTCYQLGQLRGKKERGAVTSTVAVAITVNDERFKEIVRQNQAEVEAILGAIPKAKAPFDAVSRRGELLSIARSLRSHWANKSPRATEHRLFQKICELLHPEEDSAEPPKAPEPFDPDSTAFHIKSGIAAMVRYFSGRRKLTKQEQSSWVFFKLLWDQYNDEDVPRPGFTVNSHPGYEPLAMILGSALDRAAVGKGKQRHANGKLD